MPSAARATIERMQIIATAVATAAVGRYLFFSVIKTPWSRVTAAGKNIPRMRGMQTSNRCETFPAVSAERKLDISSPPEYFAGTANEV
jgi:hypothetical protein